MIKVGCCGFNLSQKRYFKTFSVVEIQQTFYRLPQEETLLRWRKQAPLNFEYTLKAWQLITHPVSSPTYRKLKIKLKNAKNYGLFQPTKEVFSAFQKFLGVCEILESKVVIFQTPASFGPEKKNIENLRTFFRTVLRKGLIFCWEVRGKWEESLVKQLCGELELVHCVDPFKSRPLYGKINYFRLHGLKGYSYRYSFQDLERLERLIPEKKETYIMFNNVYSFENALEFKKIIF